MASDPLEASLKQTWGKRAVFSEFANVATQEYKQFSNEYKGMRIGPGGEKEANARAKLAKGTAVITMTAGKPDPTLLPFEDIISAARTAWQNSKPAPLEYGASALLRSEIAKYLTTSRGRQVVPEEIMITSGNSGGLRHVFGNYISPGDVAIVESPLWTITVDLIKQQGGQPVAVGMDSDGIRVDEVEKQILKAKGEGKRVKLIYLQPLNHNPTGVIISRARAEQLLQLAAKHGILIVSDEAYEAFWFAEKPCFLSAMSGGYGVITIHTFSKTLGTGLRLGYLHSSPEWLEPISVSTRQEGSVFWEYAVGELMASGRFSEIVSTAKQAMARKLNVFVDALARHAGKHLAGTPPRRGGFFVWLELDQLDADEVNLELLARGVEARVGKNMHGPNHADVSSRGTPANCHVGFAYIGPPDDQLIEAAKRIGAACDAVAARGPASAL